MSKQIKFLRNYDCYAKDEVASFDDDLAEVYLKTKPGEEKIAEEVGVKNTEEVDPNKGASSDNPKGSNKDTSKETNKQ